MRQAQGLPDFVVTLGRRRLTAAEARDGLVDPGARSPRPARPVQHHLAHPRPAPELTRRTVAGGRAAGGDRGHRAPAVRGGGHRGRAQLRRGPVARRCGCAPTTRCTGCANGTTRGCTTTWTSTGWPQRSARVPDSACWAVSAEPARVYQTRPLRPRHARAGDCGGRALPRRRRIGAAPAAARRRG